jgi:prune family protein 2
LIIVVYFSWLISAELESMVVSPADQAPEQQPEDESELWRSFRVGPGDVQIDLGAIQPYRKCLSHGGYFDAEKNVAIILFSGCYLPDRSRKEYTYLMDHLFL